MKLKPEQEATISAVYKGIDVFVWLPTLAANGLSEMPNLAGVLKVVNKEQGCATILGCKGPAQTTDIAHVERKLTTSRGYENVICPSSLGTRVFS